MSKCRTFIVIFAFCIVISSGLKGSDYAWLPIDNVHQDCSNLCWAACIEMVTSSSQCTSLENGWSLGGIGAGYCCSLGWLCDPEKSCNEMNALCSEPGSVQNILSVYHTITSNCQLGIDNYRLFASILQGYPIIIMKMVSLYTGHMMMIIGYYDNYGQVTVRYNDPDELDGIYLQESFSTLTDGGSVGNLVVEKSFCVKTFLEHFTPYLSGTNVKIDFATKLEDGTSHFLLERSSEGFDDLEIISSIDGTGSFSEYNFTDLEGSSGDLYRLIEVEDNGAENILEFSRVFNEKPNWEYVESRTNKRNIELIRGDTKNILQKHSNLLRTFSSSQNDYYKWVVIYPDSFSNDVSDLISWRDMNGLKASGISIEDVDSIYGNVESYIQHLWDTQDGSLEYVCLAGGASVEESPHYEPDYNLIPIEVYDYEEPPGRGDGLTYFTSDYELCDVTGDGEADIAVGRIPAESIYDIASYVNKVLTYEDTSSDEWGDEVTFFVDAMNHNSSLGSVAENMGEDLINYLPEDYNLHYMFSNDSTYAEDDLNYCVMQSKSINEFDAGRSLVLGIGNAGNPWNCMMWMHAHPHHNCTGYFCADSLSNNEKFPFFVGAGCELGDLAQQRDSIPRALIKNLLFDSECGAIGAFAPSGGTWLAGNYLISKALLQYLYDNDGARSIGYACMNAQRDVMVEEDVNYSTAKSYIYFGDPAIVLNGYVPDGIVAALDSTSLKDDYLVMCPAGDRDTLQVHIDFIDSLMTRTIAANEIWIQKPNSDSTSFFVDGNKIYADSAATEDNGWHTTITREFIGGHYQDSLSVGLINEVVSKLPVTIKSPDYIVDGIVDLSDNSAFSSTWNKCEGDSNYNKWFDFIQNDCIDLSDHSVFGTHWQHSYSDTLGAILAAGNTVDVELEVLEDDEEGTLKLAVNLISSDSYTSLAMLIQTNAYDFFNWESENCIASEVNRDCGKCVFISSIKAPEITNDVSTLGILTLKESANRNLATNSKSSSDVMSGVSLLAGEIMTPDGKISRIGGMEVKEEETPVVYKDKLWNNHPNPFNPVTTIRYSVSKDCQVSLKIFNVRGQLIKTLVDSHRKMGEYEVKWNGTNNKGNGLASGVYFYRLKTDQFTATKKMVLLR